MANEQGIIKIDWSRLYRKADEASDKVQQAVTGEGPKWMEKVNHIIYWILQYYTSKLKFSLSLLSTQCMWNRLESVIGTPNIRYDVAFKCNFDFLIGRILY